MNTIISFIEYYILIPHADAASPELKALMGRINEYVLNPLIVLLFSVALVMFIFGMLNFFGKRESSESLEKGKRHMVWGIIGMAIMVSVFGLMNFITGTLGVDDIDPANSGEFSGLQSDIEAPIFR